MKKQKDLGITLIALVITIIILLILAGISIASLTKSGLFNRAKDAREKNSISDAEEKIKLAIMDLKVEEELKGENFTKDSLNKLNSKEIIVESTESFPVEVKYNTYIFDIDKNYNVIYVGEIDGTIIRYMTSVDGYTNQSEFDMTIKIGNSKGIKTIKVNEETIEENGVKNKTINYQVVKNGIYKIEVVDIEDKLYSRDIEIKQIDRLEPLDFEISVEKEENSITIKAETQDGEADGISIKSGIDYYKYYAIDENNETKEYDTNKINGLNGVYEFYAVAYDKAGNEKQSKNVVKIDTTIINNISGNGLQQSHVMDKDGHLWSWGENSYGQLGDGTNVNSFTSKQIKIKDDIIFSQIDTEYQFTLAIDIQGNIWSWGRNNYGQLGDGTTKDRLEPKQLQIGNGTKFKSVSAGDEYCLALDNDGNIWSWGRNNYGQLGDGTTVDRLEPKKLQLETGVTFTKIDAKSYFGIALDNQGNIWSWGQKLSKNSEDGIFMYSLIPEQIEVKERTKFVQVSASCVFVIALDDQGNIWSCGKNNYGQLGDGTTIDRLELKQIKLKERIIFTHVSADIEGGFALDKDGNIWSWGRNNYGQLGDGTIEDSLEPKKIQLEEKTVFTQISSGYYRGLALDNQGNVWSWGWNNVGQLGDGTTNNILKPIKIFGFRL